MISKRGGHDKKRLAEVAAYTLAELPFPGPFCQSDLPNNNALEKKWIDNTREKLGNSTDLGLLQKTVDRMM